MIILRMAKNLGALLYALVKISEEVRDVVLCRHKWHFDFKVFNLISNEEMTTLDMFHPIMVFWIISDIPRTLAVRGETSWRVLRTTDAFEKFA